MTENATTPTNAAPAKFRKLPARYFGLALPFVISIIMSCIVSGIATVHALGLDTPDLFERWMAAWGFSWVMAFPTLLVVMPAARRIVALFVEKPRGKNRP